MKKMLFTTLITFAIVLGLTVAGCHKANAAKIVENTDCSNVTKDNPMCTITLKSNPTTGYAWFLISYDHDLLTLKKHQFVKPDTDLVGAPGTEEFQFEATDNALKAPHTTSVNLVYARSWELKDPNKIKELTPKVVQVTIK